MMLHRGFGRCLRAVAGIAALGLGAPGAAPAAPLPDPGVGHGVSRPYQNYVYATVQPRSDTEVDQIWQQAEHILEPHDPALARHTLVLTPAAVARLRRAGLAVKVEAQNVQQLVDASYARNQQQAPALADVGFLGAWFSKVQQLDAIESYLTELVARAQGRARLISIGRSIEGRDLRALLISSRPDDSARASIIVTGTQHAREWLSPMVVMGIAAGLVDGYDGDAQVKKVVDSLNVYVVPVMNPDGYLRTFNGNRLQRKNMHVGCNVDINRNFATAFGQKVSNNCNTETTSGPMAFSEPESQALRQLAEKQSRLRFYVDYHSNGNQVMIPYAYTRDEPPGYAKNRQWGTLLAMQAMLPAQPAYALAQGQGGGALDWFRQKYTESLVVELPGRGFDPPSIGVAASVERQWQGWLAVADIVADENAAGGGPDAGTAEPLGGRDGSAAGDASAGVDLSGGGGASAATGSGGAGGDGADGGEAGAGGRPSSWRDGGPGSSGGSPGGAGAAGAAAASIGSDAPELGGCGCRIGGAPRTTSWPGRAVAILVPLALSWRRRRRSTAGRGTSTRPTRS